MAHTFTLTPPHRRIVLAALLLAGPAFGRGDKDSAPKTGASVRRERGETTPLLRVPEGTVLSVELVDAVSSGKNREGDAFRLKLQEGVWLKGKVAVPPGATVKGLVTEAKASGRLKGIAKLSITLSALELEGKSYELRADTLTYVGEGHKAKHFGSGLMGALQGALYGMIFGGSADGAIIGAGAGAAAGAVGSIIGGKEDINFAQGAKLMFELKEGVEVPEPSAPASPQARPEEKPPTKTEGEQKKPEEKAGKPAG